MNTKTHQDIKHNSLILRRSPAVLRPYLVLSRLDRPIGVWLLLIPGLWAMTLSSAGALLSITLLTNIVLFALGSLIMRAAGCVVNDLWDRELDRSVERTQNRPIASGQISPRQALVFLSILLVSGLCILLQFNSLTILLGFLSLPLIITYPLMKRITWWPQAFLGLTFNFGALMGWSAMTGTLPIQAFGLYLCCILWTLAYDTIYAHQDKQDDALIGIKSTALLWGQYSKQVIVACYGFCWIGLCFIAVSLSSLWAVGAMLPAGICAAQMLQQWNSEDATSSLRTFQRSRYFGLYALAGFAAAIVWL